MSDWCVVIAAGPSLRRADCDMLRGLPAIAINCAVFFAPWVDTLYAADTQWWRYYGPKVRWFKGRRLTYSHDGPDVKRVRRGKWNRNGGNGGHQSVQIHVDEGRRNIALLAFDHKHTNGKTHFHGDHPRNSQVRLGNAANVHHWQKAMARTAIDLERKGVRVLNLSRETALTCFPRMEVEEFCDRWHHPRPE